MARRLLGAGLAGCALLPCAQAALAAPMQMDRPSLQETFRLGDDESGALCQVQSLASDASFGSMFDRAYSLICRDASAPVGRVYALRPTGDDPAERVMTLRAKNHICVAPTPGQVEGLGAVIERDCKLGDADVSYKFYSFRRGKTVYVAEGLAGYDNAVRLALRTIVADRRVAGKIEIATTQAGDPAAFARVQAGNLDLDQALAEGYRRNNSGSYAEAAEFFDALLSRADAGKIDSARLGEYIVNRALQKSNLGDFPEADALFAQAATIPTSDPVQLRLRRNFLAMHLINQRKLADATAELTRPLESVARRGTGGARIDAAAAAELNSGAPLASQLGMTENVSLTPQEKAAILDAQALQLQGTILRLNGKLSAARAALARAQAQLMAIREGRVASSARLRAQTLGELAAIAEAEKNYTGAERMLRTALVMLQSEYPRSAAMNATKARLGAYLARRGRAEESLALYREVIGAISADNGNLTGFDNLLGPYFALLARELPKRPELVDDLFLASQTLVRPGVAETSAVLARELSGGSDEASRLFRQSVNLTRDVERSRIEFARLSSIPSPSADDQAKLQLLGASVKTLEADQIATQAKLSQYPRYRALSTQAMALADLKATLKPDEAYFKLAVVGNAIYAIFVTPKDATGYRAAITAEALDRKVQALRDSIAVEEKGELMTYPYDLKLGRELYVALMDPITPRLDGIRHLIFEPDGGMLRIPPSILVTDQKGVDAYYARNAKPDADPFDFRDVAWLAKRVQISTAVSARAFRDVRRADPSRAKQEYLGFGQNQPVSGLVQISSNRSVAAAGAVDCNWPLAAWNHPIKATELYTAQGIIGKNTSDVVSGAAFSDTSVLGRADIGNYRILHFATHGLVAAPRPECPARPALLTSFGGPTSDGLLTFKEIYDLKLDADLVILSACDTAGYATVAATREAGITSGGGGALDGLVRAFVGAGGRSVIASHWPAPDDYGATERIISGLFSSQPGTTTVQALQKGQIALMNAAETSHPYYWADFVVIGDGDQAVLKPR